MPQNRKYIIAERRKEIAKWYLRGLHQQEIADKVGVSRRQIGKDLEKIHEQWVQETLDDINKAKYRELAKLDKLEQTYWEAWEKSIENHTQSSKKQTGDLIGENGNSSVKVKKVEEIRKDIREFGNPAYLQGIERCIERRCKILGIDAPLEIKHTGNLFEQMMIKASQSENSEN